MAKLEGVLESFQLNGILFLIRKFRSRKLKPQTKVRTCNSSLCAQSFLPQSMLPLQKCSTVDFLFEIINGICLAEATSLGLTHSMQGSGSQARLHIRITQADVQASLQTKANSTSGDETQTSVIFVQLLGDSFEQAGLRIVHARKALLYFASSRYRD